MVLPPTLFRARLAAALVAMQPAVSVDMAAQPVVSLRAAPPDLTLDGGDRLTRVGHLRVARDGSLFVTDTKSVSVLHFDASGHLVRQFGRAGSGPGEFRSIGAIGLRGDTVWISDAVLRRVVMFHLDGSHLRTERIVARTIGPAQYTMLGAWLGDGSRVLAPGLLSSLAELTPPPIRVAVIREQPRNRDQIDTVAVVDRTNVMWVVSGSREQTGDTRGFAAQPFSDEDRIAYSPNGDGLAIVNQIRGLDTDNPAEFTLRRFGPDGKPVFQRAIRYRPVPVADRVVDSVLGMTARQVSRFYRTPAAALETIARTLYRPRHYPPVGGVLIDNAGRTWIKLTDTGPSATQAWRGFDRRGVTIAEVSLPGAAQVLQVADSAVWVVTFTDDDVPEVKRLPLVRNALPKLP